MENIRYDLISALPEIVIVCMAMFILLADLFLKPANRIAIYVLAQVTIISGCVHHIYNTFTRCWLCVY